MAIVVLDSQDPESDRQRARAYNAFLYGHVLGQSMSKVLETPLFVDLTITPGIQIADLAASVIRQYHERSHSKLDGKKGDFFFRAVDRFYGILQTKTMNFTRSDGTALWGFYRMQIRLTDSERLPTQDAVAQRPIDVDSR